MKSTASQRTRILMLLQQAGARGITNFELNRLAFRYAARIHELKTKFGYDIRTIREEEKKFRYVLYPKLASAAQGSALDKRSCSGVARRAERSSLDYRYQCEMEFRGGCFD